MSNHPIQQSHLIAKMSKAKDLPRICVATSRESIFAEELDMKTEHFSVRIKPRANWSSNLKRLNLEPLPVNLGPQIMQNRVGVAGRATLRN